MRGAVLLVLGEDLVGVGFVHEQDVLEDLAPDRAAHWLAVGVPARRQGRAAQQVHGLGREDGVAGVGVLAVAVAENEAERLDACVEVGGQMADLLGRPLRDGGR